MNFLWAFFLSFISLSMASDFTDTRESDQSKLRKFAWETKSTPRQSFPLYTRMLNEGKGHTLWIANKTQEQLIWPSYGNLGQKTIATVILSGELEITTAPRTSYQDARALHHMMSAHDASFVDLNGMTEWTLLDYCFREVFLLKGCSGMMSFRSLLDLYAMHQQSFGHYKAALITVMTCARSLGAEKIFIENLKINDSSLNAVCVNLKRAIQELGFGSNLQPQCGPNVNFVVYEKSLNQKDMPTADVPIYYPLRFKRINDHVFSKRDSAINDSVQTMNLILRDVNGNCQGGVCGARQDRDARFLEVSLLVVQEALRGQGYGTKMMTMLRKICEEENRRTWVYPASYHNTGFLEKMGYQEVVSFPTALRSVDGQRKYDQFKYFYAADLD